MVGEQGRSRRILVVVEEGRLVAHMLGVAYAFARRRLRECNASWVSCQSTVKTSANAMASNAKPSSTR